MSTLWALVTGLRSRWTGSSTRPRTARPGRGTPPRRPPKDRQTVPCCDVRRPRITLERGVMWERLTAAAEKDIEFLEVCYPVGQSVPEAEHAIQHTGQEYVVIIEGALSTQIGSSNTSWRRATRSTFDSAIPHRFWNAEPSRPGPSRSSSTGRARPGLAAEAARENNVTYLCPHIRLVILTTLFSSLNSALAEAAASVHRRGTILVALQSRPDLNRPNVPLGRLRRTRTAAPANRATPCLPSRPPRRCGARVGQLLVLGDLGFMPSAQACSPSSLAGTRRSVDRPPGLGQVRVDQLVVELDHRRSPPRCARRRAGPGDHVAVRVQDREADR